MTNSKLVPKRRFKEFESDGEWEKRKLTDFIELFSGLTYSPNDVRKSGTLVLRSSNIKNGEIVDADNVFVTPAKATSENVKLGDIIVVVRNGSRSLIGKHARVKCEKPNTVIGAFMTGMHTEHSLFVNALLDTPKFGEEIEKNMGATINQITGTMFSEMEFIIPDELEQDIIGNFFQTIDSLISIHQHKLDKLKNLKKAYLSEMFPAEGERVPKRRFPGFEGDWEQKNLGELTLYRNGTGYEEKQSDTGKYELVNLNSIAIDGGLKPSGRFIDEDAETLVKNDLVMVLSDVANGDLLGRVAIIPEDNRFVLNQRVALLRNNGSVDIKYLFYYINAHQKYFKLQGAGSSQLNISKNSVESFEVLLSSISEQQCIGNFFKKLDQSISLQQQKLDKLNDLKKAYLNELFV